MLDKAYNLRIPQLEEMLRTGPQGLGAALIKSRRTRYGTNQVSVESGKGKLAIFFRQIWQFFPMLLAFAGLIAYLSGEYAQFAVIILVLLVNILLGFFQESKAQISLDKLKKDYKQKVEVIRQGRKEIIDSQDLVPGDLVALRSGDKVSADIRIIKSRALKIDESLLSGESIPRVKISDQLPASTPLPDRKNMAYKGTVIVAGRGQGYVVAIGARTEFAKIIKIASQEDEPSPLQKKINRIGLVLSLFAGALSGLIFLLGVIRVQMDLVVLLGFVIALLVSAVPESLPTVLLLILTKGVSLLARSRAVVRRLPAVEALGSVDLIATDKTGTLTANKLRVRQFLVWKGGEFVKVPAGVGRATSQRRNLLDLQRVMALNSNVELIKKKLVGDPTEIALIRFLKKLGLDWGKTRAKYPRVFAKPFSSQNKYMLTAHKISSGYFYTCKGAPETLLELSSLTKTQKETILRQVHALSQKGLRVLAFAIARYKGARLPKKNPKKFKFLGLAGMIDPIAPGVKKAFIRTRKSGIRTVIITGDHPATALAIGKELGIATSKKQVLVGSRLNALSKQALAKKLRQISIYARVLPTEKARIVRAYMQAGNSVAVTGDGINDAPVLKLANVGVAMGRRGADIARDASDIVLLDDSFVTIAKAVGYGRAIWVNIQKAIIFLLAGNINEIFLVAIAFLAGLPAPFTTAQVLWINLVTDSFPALALAYDEVNPNLLEHKASAGGFKRLFKRAVFLGLLGLILSGILFLIYLPAGAQRAQTIVFASIAVYELIILFSVRSKGSLLQTKVSSPVMFGVLFSLALLLGAIYSPLSVFIGAVSLGFDDWVIIITVSLAGLIIAEATKEN